MKSKKEVFLKRGRFDSVGIHKYEICLEPVNYKIPFLDNYSDDSDLVLCKKTSVHINVL